MCEDRSLLDTYHPNHWPETARPCIRYTSSLLRHKHLRDPSARRSRAQGPSLATPQAIRIAFKHKHWLAASREPSKHTPFLLACSTSCSRPNQTTTMSEQAGPCERTRPVHTLSGLFDPTQATEAPPGPLGLRRKASKWTH
jgi:hypothetical protein